MDSAKDIWVLGAKSPNADKIIEWYSKFPNFSDPDILIVNLTSLTEEVLTRINKNSKYIEARDSIWDKYVHGGTIIFITARYFTLKSQVRLPLAYTSNWDLSPFSISTKNVTEGSKILTSNDYEFSNYISQVKKFDFYLSEIFTRKEIEDVDPQIEEIVETYDMPSYNVLDKSSHYLGTGRYSRLRLFDGTIQYTGTAIYLPPPTNVPMEEAIDLLLEKYGKSTAEESPPEWISKVWLNGLNDGDRKLTELESRKKEIEEKIKLESQKKHNLTKHYRLLYSQGAPLEQAVFEAFKTLGFNNINRIRDKGKEDWVFEFSPGSKYNYAALEVKGTDKRTSQRNLEQCGKWADELGAQFKCLVKPIFIPNQNRYDSYPGSRSVRLHFEPNEKEYAKVKDICIIPSCILFDAVNGSLAVQVKSRKQLEDIISESQGVLAEL